MNRQTTKTLQLDLIRTDGGTQIRAAINSDVVEAYAEAYRDAADIPPVVVFSHGGDYWLADGFHRVYAARKAGLDSIEADVRPGQRRDAILHACGANTTHGLRRTNEDKRRAVETLLRDEEWGGWSDNEIARLCGVTHPFVGSIRKELDLTCNGYKSTARKGADGRTIDTSNIGKSRPAANGTVATQANGHAAGKPPVVPPEDGPEEEGEQEGVEAGEPESEDESEQAEPASTHAMHESTARKGADGETRSDPATKKPATQGNSSPNFCQNPDKSPAGKPSVVPPEDGPEEEGELEDEDEPEPRDPHLMEQMKAERLAKHFIKAVDEVDSLTRAVAAKVEDGGYGGLPAMYPHLERLQPGYTTRLGGKIDILVERLQGWKSRLPRGTDGSGRHKKGTVR